MSPKRGPLTYAEAKLAASAAPNYPWETTALAGGYQVTYRGVPAYFLNKLDVWSFLIGRLFAVKEHREEVLATLAALACPKGWTVGIDEHGEAWAEAKGERRTMKGLRSSTPLPSEGNVVNLADRRRDMKPTRMVGTDEGDPFASGRAYAKAARERRLKDRELENASVTRAYRLPTRKD